MHSDFWDFRILVVMNTICCTVDVALRDGQSLARELHLHKCNARVSSCKC